MKTNRNLLIATLGAAALLTLASNASAQRAASSSFRSTASPKFEQLVVNGDRAATASVPVTRAGDLIGGRQQPQFAHIAHVSPKHRELLAGRATGTNAYASGNTGYKATGADGITASPKLRQALDENAVSFQIAPVK
jgi:hypothetical protein